MVNKPKRYNITCSFVLMWFFRVRKQVQDI